MNRAPPRQPGTQPTATQDVTKSIEAPLHTSREQQHNCQGTAAYAYITKPTYTMIRVKQDSPAEQQGSCASSSREQTEATVSVPTSTTHGWEVRAEQRRRPCSQGTPPEHNQVSQTQASQTSTPERGRLEADNVGKVSSLSRAAGPARPSRPHHKAHQKHLSAVTHAHTHKNVWKGRPIVSPQKASPLSR